MDLPNIETAGESSNTKSQPKTVKQVTKKSSGEPSWATHDFDATENDWELLLADKSVKDPKEGSRKNAKKLKLLEKWGNSASSKAAAVPSQEPVRKIDKTGLPVDKHKLLVEELKRIELEVNHPVPKQKKQKANHNSEVVVVKEPPAGIGLPVEKHKLLLEELRKIELEVKPKQRKQKASLNSEVVTVNEPPAGKSNLLSQLKKLQTGQMTSLQLEVQHPLPKPKKQKVVIDKEEEMRQNKEEVQRLNYQIQQKIAQAKPKLRHIATSEQHLVNGHGDERRVHQASESSQSTRVVETLPRIQFQRKPTREVPLVKTAVKKSDEDEAEIFRYSKDDLNQLQHTATYELVPRLIDLRICALPSDLDAFLLKLVSAKNEVERAGMIWLAAEQRLLVRRTTTTDFEYCRVPVVDDAQEEAAKKPTISVVNNLLAIEAIKAVAKNDEELNEMTYRHEFCNLFEDSLKGQGWNNLPLDHIVKNLVDNNQAYIIEGEIRVNGRNNQEAYVSHPAKKRDICVSKLILRKESFHGDVVKVLVKQSSDAEEADSPAIGVTDEESDALPAGNRNFGCVLEIIEKRHNRRVIGSLINDKKKEKRNVTFSSRDPKIPYVRVGKEGIPRDIEITDKMLIVVQITSWSYETPKGVIIEIIGQKDQLKAENTAILIQHNLDPQPFAQNIIDQLPTEPFEIPAKEFEYREDLRKKCIFSIDPETARDLDDALSCEELPNGHLEIGVHISDVTYFLKENSELDELVKEKATTIYLVDQVYHMLPVPLCLLCSLLPGSDKMAYSVFWEMKPETAEIVSTRFTRSIMNSCGKLSYDHAQMVIDKADSNWSDLEKDFPEIHNGFTVTDVANVIQKLQKLAVIMQNKRKDNGALKIDQPKISFKFAKDDERMSAPTSFFQYPLKDSNRLIEEFMLLANISVAKFIYEKFPDISLLRSHDPPNENGLKKLVHNLQKHGIAIDTSSSAALSACMEQLIAKAPSRAGMNAAINLMVSKTMQRARYFCSETVKETDGFWHYALSIPMYTHFTSPIRRYADVLVHR